MTLLPLAMVAAMSRNRVIGAQGKLPWHEPEDLKHFRLLTVGHAVIMGRKTWEALGRPLKERRNIVITRQRLEIAGCDVVGSLAAAIALARDSDPEPRVIGGGEIYAQALPLATTLYLTEIQVETDGDAFFPAIDPHEWRESERRESGRCVFRTFERIGPTL